MNLLVAEDNAMLQKSYERVLRARGHVVYLAGSPKQAIAHLRQKLYIHGVISDYDLDEGAGSEIYRWVGHNRPELLGRFVFVTGNSPGLAASCPSAPVFLKPCKLDEVLDYLARAD